MNKFILPVILLIVSVGLFVGFIDPTYKEAKELKEVKSQYDVALDKSKELRSIRDSLIGKYNSFSDSDLIRIRKMIPDNVDNVRLVMDIDSVAAKYNSTIRDVKVNVPSDSDEVRVNIAEVRDYEFVTLDFSMTSTYDNFINFVTDLKDSLRLVDITNLSFSSLSQTPGVYKFNFIPFGNHS